MNFKALLLTAAVAATAVTAPAQASMRAQFQAQQNAPVELNICEQAVPVADFYGIHTNGGSGYQGYGVVGNEVYKLGWTNVSKYNESSCWQGDFQGYIGERNEISGVASEWHVEDGRLVEYIDNLGSITPWDRGGFTSAPNRTIDKAGVRFSM
jgi:hypothetical protein